MPPGKPREVYIPPAPPEDEESIFVTMDAGINFDKYDEIPVEVTGRDPPQNIQTFDECNFCGEVYNNVKKCRYHRPTPVQKYAIPIITAGRDLMACAQTGSGKTVCRAFLSALVLVNFLGDGMVYKLWCIILSFVIYVRPQYLLLFSLFPLLPPPPSCE